MPAASYEFKLNAPLELVWGALTNLQEYDSWNPFILRAAGTLEPGTDLELVCLTGEGKDIRGNAMVTAYEHNRRLSWDMGSSFKTWSVRMRVYEGDGGSTDLIIGVDVKGLPLLGRVPTLEESEDGFNRMVEALSKRLSEMPTAV